MLSIPEIVPISELRLHQNEVLARLAEGPVVITQHSRPAAILIDPVQYNDLIAELEGLQEKIAALQTSIEANGHREVTAELNLVYATEDSTLDPVFSQIQTESLPREAW